jgi:Ca2+-dependent lipid-binding protein
MITFRISEEEFCALSAKCLDWGFRSFSDLIRTAVHELASVRSEADSRPSMEFDSQIEKLH